MIRIVAKEYLVQHNVDNRLRQSGLIPVQPLFYCRANAWVRRIPVGQFEFMTEISKDRIRLMNFDIAVDKGRDLMIRIHSQVDRLSLAISGDSSWTKRPVFAIEVDS